MDPKVCLKCILSLILCVWRSESVNSIECIIGDLQQEPNVTCEFSPQTEFNEIVKSNCQLLSCEQNETINWKIIDPKKGKLQVQLQAPPSFCNFELYEIDLEVYTEHFKYDESLACDSNTSPWIIHSMQKLDMRICSNCSAESTKDCLQVFNIYFKYVYPGWYRLKVIPYKGTSTEQAQRSYRIHINNTVTSYARKKISDLNVNASLQYRSTKRELDLGIPLLIDDPPNTVKVEVEFSSDYLYGITYHGNENSSSIRCSDVGDLLSPSCQVQKAQLQCKFFNMTQGFYRIRIIFIDERCNQRTIWRTDSQSPCLWVLKKNFTLEEAIADAVTPSNDSTSPEILYTIILIVILIGIIIVTFIAKKVTWRRRELANGIIGKPSETVRKTNAEQTYSFQNEPSKRFNFGQFRTISDRPRPEVLLVYTRETQPFMELVACLRRVLDKICKCQVYDYFDPELWNDVSEDPRGWVHALIVERQAKVIIIASEVAAIRHRSLMGEFPARSYKTPHPFDHLFLYALRLLRDTMDEESYKNHFVVSFDGFTENSHVLEYFNPYTRFILPKHLNKLFEHLHDPDTTIHFDTNRLEERYEVRQLRLQLEHLKNLKLLAKSDVDTHKLYDW